MDELDGSPTQMMLDHDREKKARKPSKKNGRSQQSITTARSHTSRTMENDLTADHSLTKSSVEEYPGALNDTFFFSVDNHWLIKSEFELDPTSGSWLQELMSSQVKGRQSASIHDFTYDEFELEEFDSISECIMHAEPLSYSGVSDGHPSVPNGFELTSSPMHLEAELSSFHDTPSTERIETLGLGNAASMQWPYDSTPRMNQLPFADAWPEDRMVPTSILVDTGDITNGFQSPNFNHNSEAYSPQEAEFPLMLEGAANFTCGCYKQVITELVRFELKAEPNGFSSIDSILACQKELLLQTESILQCKMCSQSEAQANALMVIIVIIDSLLTTLDATATSGKPGILESIPDANSPAGRRQKDMGNCFKTHIDTCPLLVGGFQVPIEEKSCFIRQVLQARLSMLLLTVRRIRICMQQQLAAAFSRGRLLMIMETDRRLQLIMMKIKMAVG